MNDRIDFSHQNTPENRIAAEATARCRAFFESGRTRDLRFRLDALRRLRTTILHHEQELYETLHEELHKSPSESYMTEVSIVLSEIDLHLRKLKHWARPERVSSPFFLWPSRSRIVRQPLGTVLIIAPWNYPFQLLFNPLIGAISAGNCTVLKTSPYVPQVNRVMARIVEEAFEPGHVILLEGDRKMNTALLAERFDHIFFTGSTSFGRAVMEAAARHLTPVTLELGGKSPCIVDADADLKIAARRIIWGKLLNAGQTCVAPDYLLVHHAVRDTLIEQIVLEIRRAFGDDPLHNPLYPRIVTETATHRLIEALHHSGKILTGGGHDLRERYIAPTLIADPAPDSPLLTEEIFGPILPLLSFGEIDEAIHYVNERPRPLALYYFGGHREARRILEETTSGGACINDTIVHLANHGLPFGGVGPSGMGRYHGRQSFEQFSNPRSVIRSTTLLDIPVRYAPYQPLRMLRKLM